jgi:acyl-CoA hydrolase/RimJ/RimL family protein N-acetyltransferase
MDPEIFRQKIEELKAKYPQKFAPDDMIFEKIHPDDRIFISTACAEPQYLVSAMIKYVESHPKAFFDTEILHIWTLGVAPYTDDKFKSNFRHNSFFIGNNTRGAINKGLADYTPISLSQLPGLIQRNFVPINVALIQTSMPDQLGYLNMGISVDIVKAATDKASLVIAQINPNMPRAHGDGFIHLDDVDYVIPFEEELLEFNPPTQNEIVQKIGQFVARLIQDGDTIQVGYGSMPNAILSNLKEKKNLGVHTELLTDGIVELMKAGVIDNSRKNINRGKSVTTFCMGTKKTYEFVNDNPTVEFRTVDYTNNPFIISQINNMTAINSALEIDLTGQATAESLGKTFYSGIGGFADFMRGAVQAPGGKTILAMQSTATEGEISRIVPFLKEGAGVTLNRADVHYVVTEYGIAYLHGKNIRERAMELIAIAHPKFRSGLIQEAKKNNLIFRDQAFVPGKKGEYPEDLETYRTARNGMSMLLRPVKISDEPLIKDFFYALSSNSLYKRFISVRRDMPHERLQTYVALDYTREMVILAVKKLGNEKEEVIGLGQYGIDEKNHSAEVGIAVRDSYQNQGVGTELMNYLVYLGNKRGLLGLTAEILVENTAMLHLAQKLGFEVEGARSEGMYRLKMMFGAR